VTKTLRGIKNPESGCTRRGKPGTIIWMLVSARRRKILREEVLEINIQYGGNRVQTLKRSEIP